MTASFLYCPNFWKRKNICLFKNPFTETKMKEITAIFLFLHWAYLAISWILLLSVTKRSNIFSSYFQKLPAVGLDWSLCAVWNQHICCKQERFSSLWPLSNEKKKGMQSRKMRTEESEYRLFVRYRGATTCSCTQEDDFGKQHPSWIALYVVQLEYTVQDYT